MGVGKFQLGLLCVAGLGFAADCIEVRIVYLHIYVYGYTAVRPSLLFLCVHIAPCHVHTPRIFIYLSSQLDIDRRLPPSPLPRRSTDGPTAHTPPPPHTHTHTQVTLMAFLGPGVSKEWGDTTTAGGGGSGGRSSEVSRAASPGIFTLILS